MQYARRLWWLVCASVVLAAAASCCRPAPAPSANAPTCTADLRSWVVLGRGRHLYLQIQAPSTHAWLSGRVEYTTLSLRDDYDLLADQTRMPRVGRYRGPGQLSPPPFAPVPDNRLEARYILSIDQAHCLQEDRVFSEAYVLVGPNSNAALRTVMQACGVPLPDAITSKSGLMGEFPGIEFDVGSEVPVEEWSGLGIRR